MVLITRVNMLECLSGKMDLIVVAYILRLTTGGGLELQLAFPNYWSGRNTDAYLLIVLIHVSKARHVFSARFPIRLSHPQQGLARRTIRNIL
jgi:hypothetical protein